MKSTVKDQINSVPSLDETQHVLLTSPLLIPDVLPIQELYDAFALVANDDDPSAMAIQAVAAVGPHPLRPSEPNSRA
jgi:hypothetical protein